MQVVLNLFSCNVIFTFQYVTTYLLKLFWSQLIAEVKIIFRFLPTYRYKYLAIYKSR